MATNTIEQVTNNFAQDSSAGYCKMPDGTLIQWGYNKIDYNNDIVTITFPVAFVDTYYGFSAIPVFVNDRTMSLVYAGYTKTSINVYSKTNPVTSTSGQSFKWMAVGRWK